MNIAPHRITIPICTPSHPVPSHPIPPHPIRPTASHPIPSHSTPSHLISFYPRAKQRQIEVAKVRMSEQVSDQVEAMRTQLQQDQQKGSKRSRMRDGIYNGLFLFLLIFDVLSRESVNTHYISQQGLRDAVLTLETEVPTSSVGSSNTLWVEPRTRFCGLDLGSVGTSSLCTSLYPFVNRHIQRYSKLYLNSVGD